MKKIKSFIICILAGAAFISAGFLVKEDYNSTLLCSIGFGLIFSSAVAIGKNFYWSRPSRQEEYNARREEAHINMIDERKQYIRARSGQISYQIMTFVLLGLSFILAVFRADPWMIAVVFGLFIFQYIIGVAVFKCLEKRM